MDGAGEALGGADEALDGAGEAVDGADEAVDGAGEAVAGARGWAGEAGALTAVALAGLGAAATSVSPAGKWSMISLHWSAKVTLRVPFAGPSGLGFKAKVVQLGVAELDTVSGKSHPALGTMVMQPAGVD